MSHLITHKGIRPLQKKVGAIIKMKRPTVAKELKSFLVSVNFYRKFLIGAAIRQAALQKLINGNEINDKTHIIWTDEADKASERCNSDLTAAGTLT